MATGSTNAAGKAEPLRTLTTDQVKLSDWMKEYFFGEDAPSDEDTDVLDRVMYEIAERVLEVDARTYVYEDVLQLFGVIGYPSLNTLFEQIGENTIPNAVAISKDVLLMYNLAEADINRMFEVILQETIPNAIQEAIGDAMGGEY